MYMEEFKIFNTKILKSKTNPNKNKFTPISIGIDVNNPARNIVFIIIAFFICSKLKIAVLYE